jgi:hypothetical protein
MPKGHMPGGMEIMRVCGSLPWQALGAWSWQSSYMPLDRRPGSPEGHGPAEIVLVCAGLRGLA